MAGFALFVFAAETTILMIFFIPMTHYSLYLTGFYLGLTLYHALLAYNLYRQLYGAKKPNPKIMEGFVSLSTYFIKTLVFIYFVTLIIYEGGSPDQSALADLFFRTTFNMCSHMILLDVALILFDFFFPFELEKPRDEEGSPAGEEGVRVILINDSPTP